jgi:uncharacterized membrane protein YozB (DUF420 family)
VVERSGENRLLEGFFILVNQSILIALGWSMLQEVNRKKAKRAMSVWFLIFFVIWISISSLDNGNRQTPV